MKVLITGATGLLGKALVDELHKKDIIVHYLTTTISKLQKKDNYKGFYWNPKFGEIDLAAFDGVDVIVNLAGASLAKRWTASWKQSIIDSRLDTTKLLFDTIKQHKIPLDYIVSASAIGYYPYSLTNYYDESYITTDTEFVSQLVKDWEQEVDEFKLLGIKVSKVRIGIVLSDKGGALPQLVKPIKLGVGSVLGTGKQWQSWVHINDITNMFLFIIENKLEGIYNGVAPNPITQTTLTRAIARELNKPILLPRVPEFVLRFILGEMSELIVNGQRVSAQKIENLGFKFKFNTIDVALEDLK